MIGYLSRIITDHREHYHRVSYVKSIIKIPGIAASLNIQSPDALLPPDPVSHDFYNTAFFVPHFLKRNECLLVGLCLSSELITSLNSPVSTILSSIRYPLTRRMTKPLSLPSVHRRW